LKRFVALLYLKKKNRYDKTNNYGDTAMSSREYAEKIVDNLLVLPQEKIVEVFDFVMFLKERLPKQGITLEQAGLTHEQAINLRARLKTFEDDWNAPGMEAYDKL
jgi:hypothetical protein